jgi:hypothetical protein
MLNYIQADLYRLFHKKSNYIFWAVMFGLYGLMYMLASSQGLAGEVNGYHFGITTIILSQVGLLVIGAQTYFTVYINDLSSKNYPNVFSTGISKLEFVLAKVIVMIMYLLAVIAAGGIVFFAMYQLSLFRYGAQEFPVQMFERLVHVVITVFLAILGYSAIMNIFTFWRQSSNLSAFGLFMLLVGFVNQILQLLPRIDMLKFLERPLSYTLTTYVSEAMYLATFNHGYDRISFFQHAWIASALYLVGASVISVIVLSRSEIKESE